MSGWPRFFRARREMRVAPPKTTIVFSMRCCGFEVVRLTLEEKPPAQTHWSTRSLAQRTGLSNKTVSLIWRVFQLQPHRQENFTLSTDPYFLEKVRDVVGLYLSPPDNALVFCVDEKSQIQALERSQPVLPLRSGAPERQAHDYYRHGTTSLLAALEVATGRVISRLKSRHRSREFLSFLRQIKKEGSFFARFARVLRALYMALAAEQSLFFTPLRKPKSATQPETSF